MNSIDLSSGHMHILLGTRANIHAQIEAYIEQLHDPEVFEYTFDRMLIADVRALQHRAEQTSHRKILIIVEADRIVREAQHALLKTIEEPQEDLQFIFVLPQGAHILETVLSRSQVHTVNISYDRDLALMFLASGYTEREDMFEQFKDDESYNRSALSVFIQSIITVGMEQNINVNKLKKVEKLSRYIFDTSASIKQITQTISTLLPMIQSR